jgi:hypothetical protein
VFVAYNDNNAGVAHIAKYNNGLAGCHEAVLGVTLVFAGGMQMANNRSLVVCDQSAGAVDIIAPPYNMVTHSITGYTDAFHHSLKFVADNGAHVVYVQNYPSGSLVTTLGSSNGLVNPAGIATFPYLH